MKGGRAEWKEGEQNGESEGRMEGGRAEWREGGQNEGR